MSIVHGRKALPCPVSRGRFQVSCRLSERRPPIRAIQVDIMLELRGAPALSPFRSRKLHSRIQDIVLDVAHVYAEFMHFVDLDDDLSDAEHAILDRLLTYGPSVQVEEPEGVLFLVVPRPGTLSPWSSKATDIRSEERRVGKECRAGRSA